MENEPLVEDIQNYAMNIVDTVREPLLILDTTLRVRFANRAFYQTFQVSSEETEDRLIYELGNGQWDIPDLRTLLEDVVTKSSVFNDFELEHTFPVIGRRTMLLNARKLRAGSHAELLVLATGAGSLMLSHVNDAGFWLIKEFFNMTVPQTLKTWTVMETIIGVAGLAFTLALSFLV